MPNESRSSMMGVDEFQITNAKFQNKKINQINILNDNNDLNDTNE